MLKRHAAAAFVATALAAAVACGGGPVVDTLQVTAARVEGALPLDDPGAAAWSRAPEHPAALMVQDVTEPRLVEPGVGLINVRALHNREWVVFRLEWDDPTRDLIPEVGRSADAVAIQLPVAPGADVPNAAMGDPGKPVEILYWKAVWQDDAERAAAGGGDRLATLYPNATTDHYPYQAAPEGERDEMARRYAPAAAAGNPILVRPGQGPVQVILAEGFGSSAAAATQDATGHGTWADGRWRVTIARPLVEGEGLARLEPGARTYLALAVWDGARRNTGSLKMRSGWVPFVLEAP